jgi:hypothetical protein
MKLDVNRGHNGRSFGVLHRASLLSLLCVAGCAVGGGLSKGDEPRRPLGDPLRVEEGGAKEPDSLPVVDAATPGDGGRPCAEADEGSAAGPSCPSDRGLTRQGLEYYGTNVPSDLTVPSDYQIFDADLKFQGGLSGLNHGSTAAQGAGKFVFNRIYRASMHGVDYGEQYGIFHWWLGSYGHNSIEGGVWVNPYVTGPHYYPTLHIGGVGYQYHTCSDIQFGSGMGSSFLGDKWLSEIQISNRVLTIPGVNLAFDKDQPRFDSDNGTWLGWGWTSLNLDHPSGFKYWMSFVETYDYQGPVNGYMPEYFNWVNPKAIEDGSYAARKAGVNPAGTLATLGSRPNSYVANEQYTRGMRLRDDIYYVPVPKVPSHKAREYVIANVQSIESQSMEDYSQAIRANTPLTSPIPTQFLPFSSVKSSTHGQLKIKETLNEEEHLTVVVPPYSVGHDTYNGYIEWPADSPWRSEQNGYMYCRKLSDKWPVEAGATDELKNHPHIYKSTFIAPPDDVVRVPKVQSKYFSYNERDTSHPDFANWDVTGRKRYTVKLQNGSTATYVWFKFIEQPAVKTAKQNWPSVYTDAYLQELQSYIENLHRLIAKRSKVAPKDPVFINYRNAADTQHFEPHLVRIDPSQVVTPPAGFEVGHVPVIISVVYPEEYSANAVEVVKAPADACLSSKWTRTYFPDVP